MTFNFYKFFYIYLWLFWTNWPFYSLSSVETYKLKHYNWIFSPINLFGEPLHKVTNAHKEPTLLYPKIFSIHILLDYSIFVKKKTTITQDSNNVYSKVWIKTFLKFSVETPASANQVVLFNVMFTGILYCNRLGW